MPIILVSVAMSWWLERTCRLITHALRRRDRTCLKACTSVHEESSASLIGGVRDVPTLVRDLNSHTKRIKYRKDAAQPHIGRANASYRSCSIGMTHLT